MWRKATKQPLRLSFIALGHGGSVLVEHSFFTNNRDDFLNIWNVASGGSCAIRYCRFWNNSTGGAMFPIILDDAVQFTNNLVYGNYSWTDSVTPAILQLSQGTVVSNTIIGNNGNGLGTTLATGFHHNNLLGNTPYDVRAAYPPVTMPAVYWGDETTTEMIAEGSNSNIEAIYDYYDDFTLGRVDYTGWLTTPEPTAPAFLWRLSTSPIDPIGIQRATFDLTFSRPMDQGVNPIVTFGMTEPYTSFAVLDNAQWLDDSHWRATYDVTSLVPRGTYTVSVSGAQGTDGMEIPTDTRSGFSVDYAGEITDQTPPNPPAVIAGGKEGDGSSVEATWSANDPDSSITGYRYAIGSAAGATDIVNWTNISSNSMTRSGLGLVEGWQYWLAVQARNEGGLWSASGYSAFVAGQPFHRVFLPVVIRQSPH